MLGASPDPPRHHHRQVCWTVRQTVILRSVMRVTKGNGFKTDGVKPCWIKRLFRSGNKKRFDLHAGLGKVLSTWSADPANHVHERQTMRVVLEEVSSCLLFGCGLSSSVIKNTRFDAVLGALQNC